MIENKNCFKCRQCGICCYNNTCVLHPVDLPRIAAFLDLSIDVTIKKYLIWDFCEGVDGKDGALLRPKRKGDLGTVADYRWAFESSRACVFLDRRKRCRIHPVKPRGGRESHHTSTDYPQQQAVMDWRGHSLTPPIELSHQLARNGFVCAFLDIFNPRYLQDMPIRQK